MFNIHTGQVADVFKVACRTKLNVTHEVFNLLKDARVSLQINE